MSRNTKIIFIILSLILIAFIVLIFRFYFSVNIASKKDESDIGIVNELNDDFYSFESEKGMYGVKDGHGHVIIDAQWNSIGQLKNDRFIVSRSESGIKKYGIIDINENVVVPFIYSKIFSQMDEYLVGKVDNGSGPDGYILLDMNGNIIVEEEWSSYLKKFESKSMTSPDNYIQVKKDENIYRICLDKNSDMKIFYIVLCKEIFGHDIKIQIDDISPALSINVSHIMYNELVDNTIKYITALFENNATTIKELSVNDDYKNLQFEEMGFRGGTPGYISEIIPSITDEDGVLRYACEVSFMYTSPESIEWDGTVTPSENAASVKVVMKKNQNGSLCINSAEAEKIDISELNIPKDQLQTEPPEITDSITEKNETTETDTTTETE